MKIKNKLGLKQAESVTIFVAHFRRNVTPAAVGTFLATQLSHRYKTQKTGSRGKNQTSRGLISTQKN